MLSLWIRESKLVFHCVRTKNYKYHLIFLIKTITFDFATNCFMQIKTSVFGERKTEDGQNLRKQKC